MTTMTLKLRSRHTQSLPHEVWTDRPYTNTEARILGLEKIINLALEVSATALKMAVIPTAVSRILQ